MCGPAQPVRGPRPTWACGFASRAQRGSGFRAASRSRRLPGAARREPRPPRSGSPGASPGWPPPSRRLPPAATQAPSPRLQRESRTTDHPREIEAGVLGSLEGELVGGGGGCGVAGEPAAGEVDEEPEQLSPEGRAGQGEGAMPGGGDGSGHGLEQGDLRRRGGLSGREGAAAAPPRWSGLTKSGRVDLVEHGGI